MTIPAQPGYALFNLMQSGDLDYEEPCNICGARSPGGPCSDRCHDEHDEREALDALAATVICLDCGTNFDQPSDCGEGLCCECGETWVEDTNGTENP